LRLPAHSVTEGSGREGRIIFNELRSLKKMKKILISCAAICLIAAPALAADSSVAAPSVAASSAASAKPAVDVSDKSAAQRQINNPVRLGGMFGDADANHDGKITKEEFMAAQEKFFEKVDKNGDGVITADEVQAYRDDSKAKFMARLSAQRAHVQAAASGTPAPGAPASGTADKQPGSGAADKK
jgi:hypothetical protein